MLVIIYTRLILSLELARYFTFHQLRPGHRVRLCRCLAKSVNITLKAAGGVRLEVRVGPVALAMHSLCSSLTPVEPGRLRNQHHLRIIRIVLPM